MGELLTAEEMATRLRVRPATIRLWARAGKIPSVRINQKVIRYDGDAVILSLSEKREGGKP